MDAEELSNLMDAKELLKNENLTDKDRERIKEHFVKRVRPIKIAANDLEILEKAAIILWNIGRMKDFDTVSLWSRQGCIVPYVTLMGTGHWFWTDSVELDPTGLDFDKGEWIPIDFEVNGLITQSLLDFDKNERKGGASF